MLGTTLKWINREPDSEWKVIRVMEMEDAIVYEVWEEVSGWRPRRDGKESYREMIEGKEYRRMRDREPSRSIQALAFGTLEKRFALLHHRTMLKVEELSCIFEAYPHLRDHDRLVTAGSIIMEMK